MYQLLLDVRQLKFPTTSIYLYLIVHHQLFHEFFQALANAGGLTIHVDLIAGDENHHCLEAIFKAFGRALGAACATDPRIQGETPSTKGVLE